MNPVKEHYDKAKQHTLEERSELPTYPLQVANNRLKDYLISRYIGIGSRVLDMGCGKGGDGRRILSQRPSRYIGFDISAESVKEATRRHGSRGAQYLVGSMTDAALFRHETIQEAKPFHVINSQFCLHYAWPEFAHVLENLEAVCERGTLWLGTLVDDEQLLKFGAGNSVAQIKHLTMADYSFNMPPLVVDVKESLVPWRRFFELVEARGWQMLVTGRFGNLQFGRHLSRELKDVHDLYRYFVLVKR